MTRRVLAVAGACLALAGCGGDSDGAGDVLKQTTAKLGDIKSGNLDLSVRIDPDTEGSGIGFELNGPFALARHPGDLPVADMKYTQIAGPNQGTVGFVSDGRHAWVEVNDQAYRLPPDQAKRLEGGSGEGGGPLARLDVASWTKGAKLSDGGTLDGQATERVRGRVKVAAALNDLIEVLDETGGGEAVDGLKKLDEEDADQVDAAVRSAPLEIVTGADDHLLRRLKLAVAFEVKPRDLPNGLGRLSGADVTFDLRIEDPNGRVSVDPPANALPYTQLPRG